MCYQIVFAQADAEYELRSILLESDMDIAGDIQEHVLIKKDNEIWGGAMLAQTDQDMFHLLVFAVKQGERNKGIGSRLLNELIIKPWKYCRDTIGIAVDNYQITTVAKGKSAVFYHKNGFINCDFSKLPYPFSKQCDGCPDMRDCNPSAMIFLGPGGRAGA